MSRPILALDIGGTKMAIGLVEWSGRISAATRTETPVGPDVDEDSLWRTLLTLINTFLDGHSVSAVDGVGIGCGGPMRWPSGVVSPLNIPGWREFPLRDRLRERFPDVPVRMHNDAVCVAIGEHWRGAGRGKDNVLGMVVSTGVGGGLVLGGHIIDGASGNAGHIGHVVVDPNGPECMCGGRGCLEAIARGPAVAAWARAKGWRLGTADSTAKDLAEDARRGHPVACEALARAGQALGVAIASATHLLDIETVAIGGGLAQAGPLLFTPVEESFRRHARMEYARDVRVVAAALGQDAGLMGAAALIAAGDRYWTPAD